MVLFICGTRNGRPSSKKLHVLEFGQGSLIVHWITGHHLLMLKDNISIQVLVALRGKFSTVYSVTFLSFNTL